MAMEKMRTVNSECASKVAAVRVPAKTTHDPSQCEFCARLLSSPPKQIYVAHEIAEPDRAGDGCRHVGACSSGNTRHCWRSRGPG